jgi:chemotaxis protein CheZ
MANLSQELHTRLNEIKASAPSASHEQIVAVVHSVMASLQGQLSPLDLKIGHELEQLAKFIQDTRNEIATIRPSDINAEFIPTATDELGAVVGATEEATQKIMDCAERVDKVANTLSGEQQAELMDVVTQIFEACSFQDITGQRINKVVKTLQHIETRIADLLKVLGYDQADAAPKAKPDQDEIIEQSKNGTIDENSHLLNGPQMPKAASTQDEIDALLASFD